MAYPIAREIERCVLNAAHEAVSGRIITEGFAQDLVREIFGRIQDGKSADGDAFQCLILARDRAREAGDDA